MQLALLGVADEEHEGAVASPASPPALAKREDAAAAERATLERHVVRSQSGLARLSWYPTRDPSAPRIHLAISVSDQGVFLVAEPPQREAAGEWLLQGAEGRVHEARELARDEPTGLALFQAEGWVGPVLLHEGETAEEPHAGDAVALVGAEGAVAYGWVRGFVRASPSTAARTSGATGLPGPPRRLVEAALAALPEDLGGPWIDAGGRVVGVQWAVAPAKTVVPGERAMPGRSFAIPAAEAALVAKLLLQHGEVPRASLGILARAIGPEARVHLRLDAGGHAVLSTDADGPAARAGVRPHDIVVGVGGRPLEWGQSLAEALFRYRPGEQVELSLRRAGRPLDLAVTLGRRR